MNWKPALAVGTAAAALVVLAGKAEPVYTLTQRCQPAVCVTWASWVDTDGTRYMKPLYALPLDGTRHYEYAGTEVLP